MSDDQALVDFDVYGHPDVEQGALSEGSDEDWAAGLEANIAARNAWTREQRAAAVSELAEAGIDAETMWADEVRELAELRVGQASPEQQFAEAMVAIRLADWDAGKHPRGKGGKFGRTLADRGLTKEDATRESAKAIVQLMDMRYWAPPKHVADMVMAQQSNDQLRKFITQLSQAAGITYGQAKDMVREEARKEHARRQAG